MAQAAAAAVTLASLPDDTLLLVIAACTGELYDVPLFDAVKGLGCLSKGMRQQLHQLRPLVGIESLAVVQRPTHGPWRVTLLYRGVLTRVVVAQARQGRVRSIDASASPVSLTHQPLLAPSMARRVVPDLVGAGCSLLYLDLSKVKLDGNGTWAATFGEAAVCSAVLRKLSLDDCGLQGPLPELRLPALQELHIRGTWTGNTLTGGLEPLRGCTALQNLSLDNNQLTGGLEPLRGCKALQSLKLSGNKLTGDLEPLKGCTALQYLSLRVNQLTGGLEPLRGCTALEELDLEINQLTGGLEPLRGCTVLEDLLLGANLLTGGLEPLRGCTALSLLHLYMNQLTGDLESLKSCTGLQVVDLHNNDLTGGLEPLRGCTQLQSLMLEGNQLVLLAADEAHFSEQCGDEFIC